MKFGFWVLNQWDRTDNMTQRINEGVEQVKKIANLRLEELKNKFI